MLNKKLQRAFTLIELMTVVAIIGILVGIAVPQYQKHIRRAVCENGKEVLIGAAQVMERYHAQNNKYQGINLEQFGYAKAPVDGAEQFKITATHKTANDYTLTATPTAKLEGKGTLTLDNIGTRDATGDFKKINVWNSCNGI